MIDWKQSKAFWIDVFPDTIANLGRHFRESYMTCITVLQAGWVKAYLIRQEKKDETDSQELCNYNSTVKWTKINLVHTLFAVDSH